MMKKVCAYDKALPADIKDINETIRTIEKFLVQRCKNLLMVNNAKGSNRLC